MRTHLLKCHLEHYKAVRKGIKTFELLFNDRAYQIGDIVTLNEWDEINGEPTGRNLQFKVSYILSGISVGEQSGYVILAFTGIYNIKD